MPLWDVLGALTQRFGDGVSVALSPEAVDLDAPLMLTARPGALASVRRHGLVVDAAHEHGRHQRAHRRRLRRCRQVRVDASGCRRLGSAPAHMGARVVVKSLYGIAGWNLNYEFFSDERNHTCRTSTRSSASPRATSNLLHLMGKTVGMDVIPHTDRFSEPDLATPDLFEWMQGRTAASSTTATGRGVPSRMRSSGGSTTRRRGRDREVPRPGDVLLPTEADRLRVLFGDPGDR